MVKRLNAIYLATVPVLGIYALPNGLQLGWCLTSLLLLFNLLGGNVTRSLSIRKNEVQWFLSIFIIGFIGALINSTQFFDYTLYWHNLVSIILFFIGLIVFTTDVDISVLKKMLYTLGIAAAVICLYQRTMLILTGSFNVDFFIPGLIVNRDIETFSTNRVSAFFTEPAHLSIFLLPILNISLYERRYLLACLFAGGILFSGSTTGFLLLMAITFLYLLSNNTKKIYLFMLLLGGIVLYFLMLMYFPDVMLNNLEKLNSTNSDSTRHLGPLQYLSLFDAYQWLFGVGFNQLSRFLNMNGIHLISEWGVEINENYANAFVYSLLSYGVLGFVYFIMYLIKTIKTCKPNKGFLIFALGILASDQVFFNRNLIYLLTFLLLSQYIILENNMKRT